MKRERALILIESVITPYVGETMARASTRVHCEKLGLLGEEIEPGEFEGLVQLLSRALRVFIGEEKTKRLAGEIMERFREEA